MHFPRLPDWLVYAAAVSALLIVAVGRQERSDAPPPPPPVPGEEGLPLGPASPFDPSIVVQVPNTPEPGSGTAFSVGDDGTWLTARHVVDGCKSAAIVVADGRGVAARITIDPRADAAILTTEGGAPAVPLGLEEPLRRGARAYHPGGRTDTLKGTLAGLSGAPALDSAGRVIGVTVAESPRRGRIYTTAPETLKTLLGPRRRSGADIAMGEAITTENYGRVADGLRRDLRVAQVVCLGV
ncbi:MAG: serine protease [Caulobacter sp. 32-67-35]|nr:MAG: serine protease [Caulobacter sp. 32-67-35]